MNLLGWVLNFLLRHLLAKHCIISVKDTDRLLPYLSLFLNDADQIKLSLHSTRYETKTEIPPRSPYFRTSSLSHKLDVS